VCWKKKDTPSLPFRWLGTLSIGGSGQGFMPWRKGELNQEMPVVLDFTWKLLAVTRVNFGTESNRPRYWVFIIVMEGLLWSILQEKKHKNKKRKVIKVKDAPKDHKKQNNGRIWFKRLCEKQKKKKRPIKEQIKRRRKVSLNRSWRKLILGWVTLSKIA